MSEEHVKGALEKVGGRVKEAVGALAGDERLKAEGQFDQVKGGAHQAWGDVKDAAKDLTARLHQNTLKGEVAAEREAAAERDALKRTNLP
jgi:uncharacterized protein YjbJ (UPF0337 family)